VIRLLLYVYTINGTKIYEESVLNLAPGSYTYGLDWGRSGQCWANGMYFFVWRAQWKGDTKVFIRKVLLIK
jgi:hypothetical protein